MLRIGTETKQTPQQVLEQAEAFFGDVDLGLEVRRRDGNSISFLGGGGYVMIDTSQTNGHTDVDIASREWDSQARQFLSKL